MIAPRPSLVKQTRQRSKCTSILIANQVQHPSRSSTSPPESVSSIMYVSQLHRKNTPKDDAWFTYTMHTCLHTHRCTTPLPSTVECLSRSRPRVISGSTITTQQISPTSHCTYIHTDTPCPITHFRTHTAKRGRLFISLPALTQDTAIALGTAFKQALGEVKGIRRYGTGFAPLDEASSLVITKIANPSHPFDDSMRTHRLFRVQLSISAHVRIA